MSINSYHNGQFAITGTNQNFVVVAIPIHCADEICSNGSVGTLIHGSLLKRIHRCTAREKGPVSPRSSLPHSTSG